MGKLVLFLGDGKTKEIVLGQERLVIGRRADNDICLPYPAVSGEHASVVTILADSFLEDLGSTNGTLVNGKAVAKHFLRDRDEIDIGRHRLVYLMDDEAKVDGLMSEVVSGKLLGLTETVAPARPLPESATPRETPSARAPAAGGRDAEWRRATPTASPSQAPAQVASGRDTSRVKPASHSADQRVAAWAAEWVAPKSDGDAGPIDSATGGADGAAEAGEPVPKTELLPPVPLVRVLSGPGAGRTVRFAKDELSLGRIGVQVAIVRKAADGFRLVPVEGPEPPCINGAPVPPEGGMLRPGDTFEVAGVRLEVSLPA